MNNNKKVCVFVDGENLRHSLLDLFPKKFLYLPKTDWTVFFDWIVAKSVGDEAERVRTYWYVVRDIDFTPYNLNSARDDKESLKKILSRDEKLGRILNKTTSDKLVETMDGMIKPLENNKRVMQNRFNGWINV